MRRRGHLPVNGLAGVTWLPGCLDAAAGRPPHLPLQRRLRQRHRRGPPPLTVWLAAHHGAAALARVAGQGRLAGGGGNAAAGPAGSRRRRPSRQPPPPTAARLPDPPRVGAGRPRATGGTWRRRGPHPPPPLQMGGHRRRGIHAAAAPRRPRGVRAAAATAAAAGGRAHGGGGGGSAAAARRPVAAAPPRTCPFWRGRLVVAYPFPPPHLQPRTGTGQRAQRARGIPRAAGARHGAATPCTGPCTAVGGIARPSWVASRYLFQLPRPAVPDSALPSPHARWSGHKTLPLPSPRPSFPIAHSFPAPAHPPRSPPFPLRLRHIPASLSLPHIVSLRV